jgi:peptide/nickel transport system permease protein
MTDTAAAVQVPPTRSRSWGGPGLSRYARAFRSTRGVIGLLILGTLVAAALAAPLILPGGYDEQGRGALASGSVDHPFGTDELGRDILTRAIYGLRIDLSLLFTAVPLSMVVGTMLGLSGALSQRLGAGTQRLLDVIDGFPSLILGLCIVAIMGPGWLPLFITIAISGIPSIGRYARASWLAQQNREYVVAARVLGVSRWKVLIRHVLPNAMDGILVQGAVLMVVGVYIEAGLSIVGLGVVPPTPSLGVLLNNGLRFVTESPIYVMGPALILLLLTLAFGFVADALNDAVNER